MTMLTLDLDFTGLRPSNKITSESRQLPNKKIRCIAPDYGAFYTESLRMWDAATQQEIPRSSMVFQMLVEIPTQESTKQVASLVILKDTAVSDSVYFDYQAVGGGYQRSYDSLRLLADAVLADNRPILWPSLLNKPITFATGESFQNAAGSYGAEYVVTQLQAIRDALVLGDQADHIEILTYFDSVLLDLKTELQTQITTDLSSALDAAHAAKEQSDANALLVVPSIWGSQLSVSQSALASSQISALVVEQANAVLTAQQMFSNFLNTMGGVRTPPYNATIVAVTAPTGVLTEDVDADWFGINAKGEVVNPNSLDTTTPLVFKASVEIKKPAASGLTTVQLSIESGDLREPLYAEEIRNATLNFSGSVINDGTSDRRYYLSGGTGYYAKNTSVVIYPFELSGDRPSTGDVVDHTTSLVPAQYANPKVSVVRSGLASKSYAIPTVLPSETRPKYWVLGVDNISTNQFLDDTPSNQVQERLVRYLADWRADYNMLGFGSTDKRRPIKLDIPAGTRITVSFEIQAVSASDILKSIVVAFRKQFGIYRTNNWVMTAQSGVIGPIVSNDELIVGNPDARRVRSISADIDTPLVAGAVANAFLPPVNDPTYFIASQFDAVLTPITGGRRQLQITNQASAAFKIKASWLETNGNRVEVGRDFVFADKQVVTYDHATNANINFPSSGGSSEIVRLYCENGQTLSLTVTPGSNTVIKTIEAGQVPVDYTTVFTGMTLTPSTASVGAAQVLRLNFSNMRPSSVGKFTLESLVPTVDAAAAQLGEKTITSDIHGNGYYDIGVTAVAASHVTYVVQAQGVTKTAQYNRLFAPNLVSVQANTEVGWPGKAVVVTLAFDGLAPNETSLLNVNLSAVGMTGVTGLQSVPVIAGSDGSGQANLNYTLTIAKAQFSVTHGVKQLQIQLRGPNIDSVAIAPESAIAGSIVMLVVAMENLGPNISNPVTLQLSDVAGNIPGLAGTYPMTLTGDSNGCAIWEKAVEMAIEQIDIGVNDGYQTVRAKCAPNYSPIADQLVSVLNGQLTQTVWQGEPLKLRISFTGLAASANVVWPTPNIPIQASSLIDGSVVITNLSATLPQGVVSDQNGQAVAEVFAPIATQGSIEFTGAVTYTVSYGGAQAQTSVVFRKLLVLNQTENSSSWGAALDGLDQDSTTAWIDFKRNAIPDSLSLLIQNAKGFVTQDIASASMEVFVGDYLGIDLGDYQYRITKPDSNGNLVLAHTQDAPQDWISLMSNWGQTPVPVAGVEKHLCEVRFDKSQYVQSVIEERYLEVKHTPTGRLLGSKPLKYTINNTKNRDIVSPRAHALTWHTAHREWETHGSIQSGVGTTAYTRCTDGIIKIKNNGDISLCRRYSLWNHLFNASGSTYDAEEWVWGGIYWMISGDRALVNGVSPRAQEYECNTKLLEKSGFNRVLGFVADEDTTWHNLGTSQEIAFPLPLSTEPNARVVYQIRIRHVASQQVITTATITTVCRTDQTSTNSVQLIDGVTPLIVGLVSTWSEPSLDGKTGYHT